VFELYWFLFIAAVVEKLTYKITGSVGIITIPLQSGDACPKLDKDCPADSGSSTTFTTSIEITDEYVELAATVKILKTDGNSRTVVCLTTDAEIVAP